MISRQNEKGEQVKQAPKQIASYLGLQLIQAYKSHHQQAEEAFNKLGIYVGQEMILLQLGNEEGVPQSQLATCSGVEAPTMTKMLQRMERAGMIERRPDPADARVSLVYLTEQGRALVQPILTIWRDLEAQTLQGLTETEQALLRRLLLQVSANLS